MDIATRIERAKFRCDQIRSPGGIAGEIRDGLDAASDALAIVARLPKTSDGVPVICDGMTVYCPKGHEHKLTHPTGRLYCCKGECWDEGCQGDSGSGTYCPFNLCTATG